jgi:hypothetical protein
LGVTDDRIRVNTSIGTIRTVTGHYVTAVNGGGVGGPNTVPIHTEATEIGPWETFILDDFREQMLDSLNTFRPPFATRRYVLYYTDGRRLVPVRPDNWRGEPPTFEFDGSTPELDRLGTMLVAELTGAAGCLIPDVRRHDGEMPDLARAVVDQLDGARYHFSDWYLICVNASRQQAEKGWWNHSRWFAAPVRTGRPVSD